MGPLIWCHSTVIGALKKTITMTNEKHKGTEFSNISRVWEENEKREPRGSEIHDKGNAFSNVSDAWEENEKAARQEENSGNGDETP